MCDIIFEPISFQHFCAVFKVHTHGALSRLFLTQAKNFKKLFIQEEVGGDDYGDNKGPGSVVNGGVLEEVEQFCYLGDVLVDNGV